MHSKAKTDGKWASRVDLAGLRRSVLRPYNAGGTPMPAVRQRRRAAWWFESFVMADGHGDAVPLRVAGVRRGEGSSHRIG
jgi:hypothetical protein